jgi:diadenosine tetraphosphatase ApaH/serine/threonine PP2A family protein phosphatase
VLAILSDIHGNLEALTAVLAEIDRRGITDLLCLGDIIGYGPNPLECLDLVRERCGRAILGNHDFAVLFEPYNFNTGAESAAYWTRRQLVDETDVELRGARWRYLASLPVRREFTMDGHRFQAVHASPRRPINEYVFPDDIYTNAAKFTALFERMGVTTAPAISPKDPTPALPHGSAAPVCFIGHTHVPGVFTPGPDFYAPDEVDGVFAFAPDEKALVNVGSVGQPRDRDPRSSFAILSTPKDKGLQVEFVRLDYDIQATKRKVEATPDLDDFLGQRLLEGR